MSSACELKVGWNLPAIETMMAGETPRWSDVVSMARRAEELHFDSVWYIDHFFVEFDPGDRCGVAECWTTLAALAASTRQIALGSLVACTAFRNPALHAKIAATVDEISKGRLIFGLGSGWNDAEFAAAGLPFDHPIGRFEEAIAIIAGLTRDGNVDVAGHFYRANDCEVRPRGPRPGGPPIMIGTRSPRMLRSVARHADIWNGWAVQSLAEYEPLRVAVDQELERSGRAPQSLERSVAIVVDLPTRTGRPPVSDSPAFAPRVPGELAELLNEFATAGISHVQLMVDPNTPVGMEWVAEARALL